MESHFTNTWTFWVSFRSFFVWFWSCHEIRNLETLPAAPTPTPTPFSHINKSQAWGCNVWWRWRGRIGEIISFQQGSSTFNLPLLPAVPWPHGLRFLHQTANAHQFPHFPITSPQLYEIRNRLLNGDIIMNWFWNETSISYLIQNCAFIQQH